MVQYVPFHAVVSEPIREFRLRYKDERIQDEVWAGELAQRATRGDLESYRYLVARTTGYAFYHHAPNTSHQVITADGERRTLSSRDEIREFYRSLPEEERTIIREAGNGLVELVG